MHLWPSFAGPRFVMKNTATPQMNKEQAPSPHSTLEVFMDFFPCRSKSTWLYCLWIFPFPPPVLIWCCECCGHTRRLLWRQKAQLKSSWRTCRAFSLTQDTAPVQTHGILITDWLTMPAIFKVILGLAQALEQLFLCWTYTSATTSLLRSSVKA